MLLGLVSVTFAITPVHNQYHYCFVLGAEGIPAPDFFPVCIATSLFTAPLLLPSLPLTTRIRMNVHSFMISYQVLLGMLNSTSSNYSTAFIDQVNNHGIPFVSTIQTHYYSLFLSFLSIHLFFNLLFLFWSFFSSFFLIFPAHYSSFIYYR